jgi:hypothetical protein
MCQVQSGSPLPDGDRDPLPLLEGARRVGDPIAVLPTLFHLRWTHVLEADLDSTPLSASSVVRIRG